MDYIKTFNTYEEYKEYSKSEDYIEPHVSWALDTDTVQYNKQPIKGVSFTATSTITIGFGKSGNAGSSMSSINLEYSFDGDSWTTWDGSKVSFGGDKPIYIRGNNPDGLSKSSSAWYGFTIGPTLGISVSFKGNIMNLLSYEEDLKTIPCDYCFMKLFYNCYNLVEAPDIFPATALTEYCYDEMFRYCSNLTNAPELPATTLAKNCYAGMFESCPKLVNAPELPATTLATNCYQQMFAACTSLTTLPELGATTLANGCYWGMCSGCTALNNITMLATDISPKNCLGNWVAGVASSGTFTCANGMSTVIPSGVAGIPTGWTIVEQS